MQVMLDILTHPLLAGVRHGFFTRKGGASTGLYEGLNCGPGSGDQAEAVRVNRTRAAEALEVPLDHLAGVHQAHTARVVTIKDADDIATARETQADALVTTVPGIALSVLTADCQPILLADPDAGVIAAVHAGWRGAFDGVIESTIDAMHALGAAHINAAIGPCISQSAYEVDWDFMEQFTDDDPGNARFFAGGPEGKPMFDLPSFGLAKLRDMGADAGWVRRCTYGEPDYFYSYRRATHENQADYGRLISAIVL